MDMDVLVKIIATRLAKREHGERYGGYESSHREAAQDIANALSIYLQELKADAFEDGWQGADG